jgi:hypothetical protein
MRALDADDLTSPEAIAMLRELGPNGVLADVGDATGRLGRATTAQSGAPASRARRFLDERQLAAQESLRQTARRAASGGGFDEGIVSVINNAESAAAPIYNEVYSQVLDVTPPMMDMLRRPAMVQARKKAAVMLRNEGFSSEIVDDVTDVRYMDAVKRALQDTESVC